MNCHSPAAFDIDFDSLIFYLPVVNTRQMDATDWTALVTKPPAMLADCCAFCNCVGNIISGGC